MPIMPTVIRLLGAAFSPLPSAAAGTTVQAAPAAAAVLRNLRRVIVAGSDIVWLLG